MNTLNNNYYFTNILSWLNPDKDIIRDQIVLKLLFDQVFVNTEVAKERSTYYKNRKMDLTNIHQAREFLQHVMERNGASQIEYSNDAMLPEGWITNQLLNYCMSSS